LASAGYIIQGMTLEEIQVLQLDIGAVEALGQYSGWSEAQVVIDR